MRSLAIPATCSMTAHPHRRAELDTLHEGDHVGPGGEGITPFGEVGSEGLRGNSQYHDLGALARRLRVARCPDRVGERQIGQVVAILARVDLVDDVLTPGPHRDGAARLCEKDAKAVPQLPRP